MSRAVAAPAACAIACAAVFLGAGAVAVAWAGPVARGGAVVEALADGAAIDWTRGLLIAPGAAAADLRAPSPQVARVAGRSRAIEEARERLSAHARALALAGDDRTVGERAASDPAVARRVSRALGRALTLSVRYGSDGSAVATAAVPLEALRLAVVGPPPPSPTSGSAGAITAVIVDARRVVTAPSLGVGVAIDGEVYRGPVVYAPSVTAARRDRRAGKRRVEVVAARLDGGAIELRDARALRVAALRGAGALVVIVPARPAKPL